MPTLIDPVLFGLSEGLDLWQFHKLLRVLFLAGLWIPGLNLKEDWYHSGLGWLGSHCEAWIWIQHSSRDKLRYMKRRVIIFHNKDTELDNVVTMLYHLAFLFKIHHNLHLLLSHGKFLKQQAPSSVSQFPQVNNSGATWLDFACLRSLLRLQ